MVVVVVVVVVVGGCGGCSGGGCLRRTLTRSIVFDHTVVMLPEAVA